THTDSTLTRPPRGHWHHGPCNDWYTDTNLTQPWRTGPVSSNTTLHAKWTRNTYTVTIDQNGGTGAPTSLTVTDGQAIGTLTTTKPGHHLTGWTRTSDHTTWNPDTDPVHAPMTIQAKWEADQYTVRFLAPGLTPNPTITDQTGINYGT
ncbi:hypothetical protein CRD60_08505, partial [Bifidobacterium aemilianum]